MPDKEDIIVVCANCKKVKLSERIWEYIDIKGIPWNHISHGLCPECIEDLYGEYFLKK